MVIDAPFGIEIVARKVHCRESWESKWYGVVFVEKDEDIEPLFKDLVEQDEYWKNYKELIQIAPKKIDKKSDLEIYCEYVGKTDIYNIKELKKKHNFIMDFLVW